MRAANWIFAVLFGISAGLQYNDPDAGRWMLIYGLAAIACVQHGRHRRDIWLPAATGMAAAVWAVWLTPELIRTARLSDLVRSMDDPHAAAELARELGGLVITWVWMAVLALIGRRTRQDKRALVI